MRVRGLHTYPTLSAAVTEFEQMAAVSGLLPLGDGEGEETDRQRLPSLTEQRRHVSARCTRARASSRSS